MAKRTLITGGAGFLGSHMCDRLVAEGHFVICMDNLITGNIDNIAHLFGNNNFKFIKHDCKYCYYYYAQENVTSKERNSDNCNGSNK